MGKRVKRNIVLISNFFLIPLCLLASLLLRVKRKVIDIGIGPMPMINNVYFKKALVRKGYSAETFSYAAYFITEEFDYIVDLKTHLFYLLFPILFDIRIISRYKCVYLYFNGAALMKLPRLQWIEPFLFRIAGTKIVVMPYGSDCQCFMGAPNKLTVNALCKDYPQFFKYGQLDVKNNMIRWTKYADIVVGAMDSVDYMYYWDRLRFCHYAIDTDQITPHPLKSKGDIIRILHAPNHKEIKGTKYVVQAIEQLKTEGYNIEFVFVQGVSNKKMIELIQSVDIVVDQLIMGCYAMFAMESMACGKPTICYIRDDLKFLFENTGCIEPNELPLISATPTTIKNTLKSLIDNRGSWVDISRKSREYVEKYHSLDAIGEFYDEINKTVFNA